MNVNKYKVNISTTFNTSNEDRKVKFKLKKGLKAYKSISDISRKNNSPATTAAESLATISGDIPMLPILNLISICHIFLLNTFSYNLSC